MALPQRSLPTLFLRVLSPSQETSVTGTRCSSYLSLSSGLQVFNSSWDYLNKPIPFFSGEQRAPHPLDTTKPTSHSPGRNSHVVLCGVWQSPLPGCVHMALINCCQSHLSSIGCHVFSHPHKLGKGIPCSSIG